MSCILIHVKTPRIETVTLEKIVGGGQTLGQLADGRKCFVWGGLPGETVSVQITKLKSHMAEGVVVDVITPSPHRIAPQDPDSYLSTSPWQIMTFADEQTHKSRLIDEAFTLHHVTLPKETTLYSDDTIYGYRNKVEFSFYGALSTTEPLAPGDEDVDETVDLAFFKRASRGKIIVNGTSLAMEPINQLARHICKFLEEQRVSARQLKTLLIRADQKGNCVWQLYVKETTFDYIADQDAVTFPALGGEVIYSDPRSPASRISQRLYAFGDTVLEDTLLDVPFRYATEGFFQVNLPAYTQTLKDMKQWIPTNQPVVDLYSGVGSIGLTIGGDNVTLVEINEDAIREMRRNIKTLKSSAQAVLAASEQALETITSETTVIVDPPRAGLHPDVIARLLEQVPPRIVYLSCNPVTQARDVSLLLDNYAIVHQQGYNFFPRTPHIEHLVVLDRQPETNSI